MKNHILDETAAGRELSESDIRTVCEFLLDDSNPVGDRAEFLQVLHKRGETPGEIAGFVNVLLERAVPLPFPGTGCIDVCGTGGDGAGFFNVSTAVMFVVAACGVRVVKHGNRAITSRSGGADALDALGIRSDLGPEKAAKALETAGCCFLFAPAFHPAYKAVKPVRELMALAGETSIFNLLGPLLNPAKPEFQLAGVADPANLDAYAATFALLGRRRAWAVHGTGPGGLRIDEVSPLGTTRVIAVEGGSRGEFTIEPANLGLPPLSPAHFAGGDSKENAAIIADILAGNLRDGPRQIVLLNAAAALAVAGTAPDLRVGMALAAAAIDEGGARDVLDRLRACR
jgi:anthranilate phosphoribosyltransferase